MEKKNFNAIIPPSSLEEFFENLLLIKEDKVQKFCLVLAFALLPLYIIGCSFISYKDPTKEVFYGEISQKKKIKKQEQKENEQKNEELF